MINSKSKLGLQSQITFLSPVQPELTLALTAPTTTLTANPIPIPDNSEAQENPVFVTYDPTFPAKFCPPYLTISTTPSPAIFFVVSVPTCTATILPPSFVTPTTVPSANFFPAYVIATLVPSTIIFAPPILIKPFIPSFTKALLTTL